jgi:hypothetical protein
LRVRQSASPNECRQTSRRGGTTRNRRRAPALQAVGVVGLRRPPARYRASRLPDFCHLSSGCAGLLSASCRSVGCAETVQNFAQGQLDSCSLSAFLSSISCCSVAASLSPRLLRHNIGYITPASQSATAVPALAWHLDVDSFRSSSRYCRPLWGHCRDGQRSPFGRAGNIGVACLSDAQVDGDRHA